jgi:3,4-dihydroxy 2-butanone 4-phosphate synthase / GTP cyclohydrolase II
VTTYADVPAVRSLRRAGESTSHPGSRDPVERVRAALAEIAAGRPVIVVDDEDGENEGDLVFASELATPQLVAFVVRHTSGFLCVAVTGDEADRLDLPPMLPDNTGRFSTAYCVTVDAQDGIGTGISARDRAHTIRLLAAPQTTASDLLRPGHVVPLRARPGGVLRRSGRAEAAVDLAVLAGLRPSGALCGVVSTRNPAGMARGPELAAFAREHRLQLISIADLVAHRLRVESLVERAAQTAMPTSFGTFTAVGYRSRRDDSEHLALVRGEIGEAGDVPVHVHHECLSGDTLGALLCDCGARFRSALASVAARDRGVVVYLRGGEHIGRLRQPSTGPHDHAADLDLTAAILRDLGVRSTVAAVGAAQPHAGTA